MILSEKYLLDKNSKEAKILSVMCQLQFVILTTQKHHIFRRIFNIDFTSKELDEETGYGYFGARYMDHELMMGWLSVDPMADKYPSLSPYNYCAWNPMRLVDPDGREIWIGQYSDSKCRKYIPNSKSNTGGVANMLDNIYNGSKAGRFVIDKLVDSKNRYYVSSESDPNSQNENPDYTNPKGRYRQIYLNSKSYGLNPLTLSHELFHAFQHENKSWGKTMDCEVEAFVFAGLVGNQIGLSRNSWSQGIQNAFLGNNSSDNKCRIFEIAMNSLSKCFNATYMKFANDNFANKSVSGVGYKDLGYKQKANYSPTNSLLNRFSKSLY